MPCVRKIDFEKNGEAKPLARHTLKALGVVNERSRRFATMVCVPM